MANNHLYDVSEHSKAKMMKTIILAFAVMAACFIGIAVFRSLTGGDNPVSVESTMSSIQTTITSTVISTVPSTVITTVPSTVVTVPSDTTVAPSANVAGTTQPTTVVTDWRQADPSSWTKEQIVTYLGESVNKTKAYTGQLTVHHSESFDAEVLECTGGSMAEYVANAVVSTMSKPTKADYQYNNGSAVDEEGNTIPLLLPLTGSFTLPADGVQSATATKNGDSIDIHIQLVPEKTTQVNEVPQFNSQGVGYLQLTQIQNYLTLTGLDIDYQGSEITANVRGDGYVSKATYDIPIHTVATGKKGVLTGTITFQASQQEIWELAW